MNCYNDNEGRYFCPLCHSKLRELEADLEEESAETMQNKIKSQVNSTLENYHSDLIGTLERLKGQKIHPIHPRESIERELKEKFLSVVVWIVFDIGKSIQCIHRWWWWWPWRWWPFTFIRHTSSHYRNCC